MISFIINAERKERIIGLVLAAAGLLWLIGLLVFDVENRYSGFLGAFVFVATGSIFFNKHAWIFCGFPNEKMRIVILAAIAISIVTLFVLSMGWFQDAAKFEGAVFASWVASIMFFVCVGAVATALSLSKPEHDSFEARARILFRGASGKHVDYAIERMKEKFEHYSTEASLLIIADQYESSENKIYISEEFSTKVQSHIEDLDTQYKARLFGSEITDAPPGDRPNRLVFLEVGGQQTGGIDNIVGNYERSFSLNLARGNSGTIRYKVNTWIVGDSEECTFEMQRFTQKFIVMVENQIPGNRDLHIKIETKIDNVIREIRVPNGGRETVLICSEIPPETDVYGIWFSVPKGLDRGAGESI